MNYLVDVNVLSEAMRPEPDGRVIRWLREHEREIAIDPLILGEIRFGIHLLPSGARRKRLEQWFAAGVQKIHCLVWEAETGLRWAKLVAELRIKGKSISVKDSLIAATALQYGLVLVTRNVRDFQKTGVMILDPFK